jgi:hypothetical protein
MSNQTLEGWGTSLAWFANSVGSWTNTTNQNNLEVSGASRSKDATVEQWEDSGSSATNEHWNIVVVGDGSNRIVNLNSGLDLEVNGTTGVVDQWQDVSGATNEHWTLTMTN